MENVIIVDPVKFEKKKKVVKSDGKELFQIVSDFDRTLTVAFIDGKKSNTSFAQIRDGSFLAEEYRTKANNLFQKYYPIEMDPTIPQEEKKDVMTKWFRAHLKLMVDYGLTKRVVQDIAKSKVFPRNGFKKFIAFTIKNQIPLVILSSGVGDLIREFLLHNNFLVDNVHLISNLFEWKDGKAVAVKEPVIASFNKSSFEVEDKSFLKKLESRVNVLVMGDVISDLDMIKKEKHKTIISVGFVNADVEQYLEEYKKYFDVLILNDGPLDFVNDLLKELFE